MNISNSISSSAHMQDFTDETPSQDLGDADDIGTSTNMRGKNVACLLLSVGTATTFLGGLMLGNGFRSAISINDTRSQFILDKTDRLKTTCLNDNELNATEIKDCVEHRLNYNQDVENAWMEAVDEKVKSAKIAGAVAAAGAATAVAGGAVAILN